MMGLGFGRIANFVNAELWGRPTGFVWGVVYPRVDPLPRHPSELYESASHFLAFGALLWLAACRANWVKERAGRLSGAFLILYGSLRFLTDFFRDEPLLGPLNTGQYASLVVLSLGTALLPSKLHRGGGGDGPDARPRLLGD